MIIIINQKLLQSFVHDDELRSYLTRAVEYNSPDDVQKLREFLVHAGYATKVSAPEHVSQNLDVPPAREEDDE